MTTYTYHPRILEALAGHGLRPQPTSSPQQLRDAVRDLYKYEIKRLRAEHLSGRIARRDYAGHVIALRRRYPILSVPVEQWVVLEGAPGERPVPDSAAGSD